MPEKVQNSPQTESTDTEVDEMQRIQNLIIKMIDALEEELRKEQRETIWDMEDASIARERF